MDPAAHDSSTVASPAGESDRRAHHEREQLIAKIAAEYREMAGMSLTRAQAARLFHMDADRCDRIIAELVRRGIVSVGPDGLIIRPNQGRGLEPQ